MTDDQKKALAERLHDLRRRRGWSQAELARRAGLNRNVINTAERAQSAPTPENLARIATALQVEPKDLTDAVTLAEIRRAVAAIELTEPKGRPGFTHIQINRLVRSKTALEIFRLLTEEPPEAMHAAS